MGKPFKSELLKLKSTYEWATNLNLDSLKKTISNLQEGLLAKSLGNTGAKSFFLVVGYASTTGDAASNYGLSAKRATVTAGVIQKLKAEGQAVKAVYIGQTDRFSKTKPADNQVCEVWEIKM